MLFATLHVCVTLSLPGNLEDPSNFFGDILETYIPFFCRYSKAISFPRKFPSPPIPGKISRFLGEFCFLPKQAYLRVVTSHPLNVLNQNKFCWIDHTPCNTSSDCSRYAGPNDEQTEDTAKGKIWESVNINMTSVKMKTAQTLAMLREGCKLHSLKWLTHQKMIVVKSQQDTCKPLVCVSCILTCTYLKEIKSRFANEICVITCCVFLCRGYIQMVFKKMFFVSSEFQSFNTGNII